MFSLPKQFGLFSPAFSVFLLPFLRPFAPLQFNRISLVHRTSLINPGLLSNSGSTTPCSGFGSVARGLHLSACHTTPTKRQLRSEGEWHLNFSANEVLWTGNRGPGVLFSDGKKRRIIVFLTSLNAPLIQNYESAYLYFEQPV